VLRGPERNRVLLASGPTVGPLNGSPQTRLRTATAHRAPVDPYPILDRSARRVRRIVELSTSTSPRCMRGTRRCPTDTRIVRGCVPS
jgi:hypothetical protein